MNKVIFLIVLGFFNTYSNAQKIDQMLATYVCKQLDSIKIETYKTNEQKKEALLIVFAKAVSANEKMLLNSSEFKTISSYEQGKKLGQIYSQKIVPILIANCPKFRKLLDNK